MEYVKNKQAQICLVVADFKIKEEILEKDC